MAELDPADPPDGDAAARALALAEQAEAEARAAEEAAAAARARARAMRTRRGPVDTLTLAARDGDTDNGETDGEDTDIADVEPAFAPPVDRAERWRFTVRVVLATLTVLAVCALLAASYLMIVHHRKRQADDQLSAEFAAAARQNIVTLMSLDAGDPGAWVRNVLDNSTGDFKEEFELANLPGTFGNSKVATETTVGATAVESVSADSAVVLVAATSRLADPNAPDRKQRDFAISVTMTREGDRLKMSKVEFVG